MESLIALLVLWLVLAVVCSLLVLPVFVLATLVRPDPQPQGPPGRVEWTDDDEIAARHHH